MMFNPESATLPCRSFATCVVLNNPGCDRGVLLLLILSPVTNRFFIKILVALRDTRFNSLTFRSIAN